jgi:site-specific DNA-methyltransferase (cytosine-N4-specific)
VLDPFFGSGTTGVVCNELGRQCTGVELNEDYAELARKRLLLGK